MKHATHLLAVPVLAAALAGCVHTIGTPYSEPPAGLDHPYHVSEKAEILRVAVEIAPADTDSATLATALRETAVTTLRGRKFNVGAEGKTDLSLRLGVRESVYNNAADEYFTLDGDLSATLADDIGRDVLAEGSFRDRAGPVLGRADASRALADKLRPSLASWIDSSITPDQIPLAAVTIQVYGINWFDGGEVGFVRDFVKTTTEIPGILRCETESVDPIAHTATFRVFYHRRLLPQGVIPAIAAKNRKFHFVL